MDINLKGHGTFSKKKFKSGINQPDGEEGTQVVIASVNVGGEFKWK